MYADVRSFRLPAMADCGGAPILQRNMLKDLAPSSRGCAAIRISGFRCKYGHALSCLSLPNVQDEPRPLGAVGSGVWLALFWIECIVFGILPNHSPSRTFPNFGLNLVLGILGAELIGRAYGV